MKKLYSVASKTSGEEVRRLYADEIRDNGNVLFLRLEGKTRGFWRKDRFVVREVE